MQHICSKDFFSPTHFNPETKNQIWMSQIADGHDNICNCNQPFAHLLACIFPPGHQDRDLSINQILQRDYKEKCLSGGRDAGDPGLADGGDHIKPEPEGNAEEDFQDEGIDAMLAAAATDIEQR